MELGARKERIVSAVVGAYIRTGEPVGSKALAQAFGNAVSSATIRNEMAELSALGYLIQPHTSAGRIPTVRAYRLYVDRLMDRQTLSEETKHSADEALSAAAGDPDRLMAEASAWLADVTGYAAVAATPDQREYRVRRVQILPTGEMTAAVLLMTDVGGLRSRVCRLSGVTDVSAVGERLDREFAGKPLSTVTPQQTQGLLSRLIGEYGLSSASLLTAFLELAQEAAKADVCLSGQFNLLQHPDYQPDRACSLLSFLSRREQVAAMLKAPAGLSVVLSGEAPRPELLGSSVIVTRTSAGDRYGSLGLIGPLRMDYAAVIPHLEYAAQTVSRLMAALFDEK